MKKYVMAVLCLCIFLMGCQKDPQETQAELPTDEIKSAEGKEATQTEAKSDIDVDLTVLSSTMVYSEVYNIMSSPNSYLGKKIKAKGSFSVYHDDISGKDYFAVIIADATSCCSQGIEFVLADNKTYPDDYPELGSEITVQGIFETYKEGENEYCNLTDAELV